MLINNDVFAERVRNKSTKKNPGFSWDSNARPMIKFLTSYELMYTHSKAQLQSVSEQVKWECHGSYSGEPTSRHFWNPVDQQRDLWINSLDLQCSKAREKTFGNF